MNQHSISPHTVYLASSSSTRQQLLRDAGINFAIINQTADEHSLNWNQSLEALVKAIALLKMNHVVIPVEFEQENAVMYILTADTLAQSVHGQILGKPHDRNEAIEQIKMAALGSTVGTGFCIEKKQFNNGKWLTKAQILQSVTAFCTVEIPDTLLDYYLDNSCAMYGCGSIVIDGIGMFFVKEIRGSYSAILGLPLFEVRKALEEISK